ncbi:MAG: 3-phosphoshikimate 1-carboxyvinyltransferase [Sphingobacteriales bacterium]|nr:MAG: 3-phosphoshikimate 1-carboxyvinyltransferase [Sphingobacteriales bacterium]
MNVTVEPGFISGALQVPASKSMMQRACAAALLHHGKTIIHNAGHSNDDQAALGIIRQMGARAELKPGNTIEIHSNGIYPIANAIDCGESGLSARMFTPIMALSNKRMAATGHGTLTKRPMQVLDDLLPQLGVTTQSSNGCLPFYIEGPLKPRNITIDGSSSSQFLTGFLFAFSYQPKEAVTIEVTNLKSKPYIDMTLEVLDLFGKLVANHNYERFVIDPSLFKQKAAVDISIEADWSSAAFWLVAGVIAGDITLSGLNNKSVQADKAILDILNETGASLHIADDNVTIRMTETLKSFSYDATDAPDLFPMLAVLAAYCEGQSRIRGTHRLKHKESDRLLSITEMLDRFGVHYIATDDELTIEGGGALRGCEIDAYNDHRIAMAAAIAALGATGPVTIQGAEAVDKSYPDFFAHLSLLGGKHTTNTND